MVGAFVVFVVHPLYLHLSIPTSSSIATHTHTHTLKWIQWSGEHPCFFFQIIFELVRLRLRFCSASELSATFSPESSRRDASSFLLEQFVIPRPPTPSSVDLITIWKTVGEFQLTVLLKCFDLVLENGRTL